MCRAAVSIMTHPGKFKVIFDTDPGVDDAMALYFALAHPAIDVVGITTTFGNVSVEQAAINSIYLTGLSGHRISVTRGAARPWRKPPKPPPSQIHGLDGLGNLPQRLPVHDKLDPRSSAQFIVDMARAQPGEISLVAVGPLGNLSLALKLEPELPRLLREVVLMGGSIVEPGNVSPVAEANIWNDPHAADQVFTAGWKLAMVSLDVTHRVVLPFELFHEIARKHQHAATDTLLHAVDFYSNFYSEIYPHVAKVRGCFGHDVLAFIYLVDPSLFEWQTGRVRVATEGLAEGQTIMNRKEYLGYAPEQWGESIPRTQVCMEVDAAGANALFERTLMGDWLN